MNDLLLRCKRVFPRLLFCCLLLVLSCPIGGSSVPVGVDMHTTTDTLRDARARENQSPEAVLTDASHLYRICNSRPQRLLPQSFSPQKRQLATHCHALCFHHVKSPFGGTKMASSAPFRPAVASAYYVIALRHILR